MKCYTEYKRTYKEISFEYYIAKQDYFKEKNVRVVKVKIRKDNITIKRLEIRLPSTEKLNAKLQEAIEKYIVDYCEYELKEVLL